VRLPRRANFSLHSDPYADNWAKLKPDYEKHVDEEMRVYYAQTANIDWNLGRLMKTLDELGVADNTILVFTSDHGEMFGSHGRRAKYIFYEEATRVPFLVRWPSRIPKKTVSEALLGTPDIMPTLLSMMDLRSPRSAEGFDLSAHALGNSTSQPEQSILQGMGTTAAWQDGAELLFDNLKDPYQLRNLAGEKSEASKLTHFRDRLTKWRKEHNDGFESCTWYRDHWTKARNITSTASGVGHDLGKLDKIVREYYPEGLPVPTR
jgi:arylsulfatase A-like enzyme